MTLTKWSDSCNWWEREDRLSEKPVWDGSIGRLVLTDGDDYEFNSIHAISDWWCVAHDESVGTRSPQFLTRIVPD